MSFKEFLDKQTMRSIPEKFRKVFPTNERYISVKALGEWAWIEGLGSLKEHIEESKPRVLDFEDFAQPNEFDDFGIDYFSISLGCLGGEEIKKRLKELDK